MANKKYVWDSKTKSFVVTGEGSKASSSASAGGSSVNTRSARAAQSAAENTEWQSFLARARASAAAKDIAEEKSLPAYQQEVANQIYKPGASNALKVPNFQLGGKVANLEKYRKALEEGLPLLGLSDDEATGLLGMATEKQSAANQLFATTRARTGDASVLDNASGGAYDEYARLLRLSGFDALGEMAGQKVSAQMKDTSNVDLELPSGYDFNTFGDDIFSAKYGELKDGTKLTESERQMYKKRIEALTGIDDFDALSTSEQLNLTYDENYLEQLKKMNSGAETYRDVLDLADAYSNDDLAADMMTIRDYHEGHVNVSEDDFNRAVNRVRGMTGANMQNRADVENAAKAYSEQSGGAADFSMDDYINYVQSYARNRLNQMRSTAEQAKFDDEISQKYGQYAAAPDFAEKSRPVSSDINPSSEAEAIHEAIVAIDDEDTFDRLVSGERSLPKQMQKYNASTVTPEQRAMFNYLWNSGMEDQAIRYVEDIDWSVRKMAAAKTEEVSEELSEGVLGGIASSAASVLASPARAAVLPLNTARSIAGEDIDQYDPSFNVGRSSEAIRSNVGQNLDEALGGANIAGWNIGSGIYQGAMSVADNLMLAGLGAGLGAPVMGLEAADSQMRTALENGRTQGEALRDAYVTAGIEAATEKLPMETLFGDVGDPVKYVISNALSEAGEEVTSELVSTIYDQAMYGDDSDLGRLADELRTKGYAGDGLTTELFKEIVRNVRDAAFSGLAGGAVGAAPRAVGNAVENRAVGKNLQSNDAVRSVLDFADKVLPDGDIKSMAQEQLAAMDGSAEEGKTAPKVSNAKIGRIYREVMNAVDADTQAVLETTTARYINDLLVSRGVKEPGLAQAVSRVVRGDGSASAEDYAKVGANDAALEIASGLTQSVEAVRETVRKADELSEFAAKKRAPKEMAKAAQATAPESEPEAKFTDEELAAAGIETDERLTEEVSRQTVEESAEQYGANADIVRNAYNEGQDPVTFTQQFQRAFEYGREGRNVDVIKASESLSGLTEQQITTAYQLGRGQRQFRQQNEAQKKGVTVGNIDTSSIRGMKLNQAQSKSVGAISSLAKAVGFNVRFFASAANEEGQFTDKNGSWNKETRTISIDVNAGRISTSDANYAMMQTAGHELTHFIKDFADNELFNSYQDFVFGHLSDTMDEAALDSKVQEYIERWAQMGKTLSHDDAIEEIVADASGDVLLKLTEADVQQLAEKNPSLLKRIGEFVQRWVKNVRSMIADAYKGQTARNAIAEQMADAADELGRRWAELLKNAAVNARETEPVKAEKPAVAEPQTIRDGMALAYQHIDQRTPESICKIDNQLFCSEVEEAQSYYAAAAEMLLYDAENSTEGRKFFIGDGEVTGQKRSTNEFLAQLKDSTGWTWENITKSLRQFAELANGEMPKNTVTNREMELYLDEVLSNGYTTLDGKKIAPATDYIEAKNQYQGGKGAQPPARAYERAIDFIEYAMGEVADDSVRFSMREPVEQTKNLIAVHNIREDNLRKALNLGGFPMPSIAIAKNDIGHQNFGPISLVFGKDTIDPKANKRNKVYSADAWTPTFPQVEYEVDSKADTRIYNKLTDLKRAVDPYFADDLSRMMYGIEEQINRYGGEEGLVQRAMDSYGLKAAYLEDIGEHAEVVQRTETEQRKYPEKMAEIYTKIAALVGAENIHHMPMSQIYSEYGEAIEDVYPGSTNSKMRFQRILVNVAGYLKAKDAAPTQTTVTDTDATRNAIDQRIDSNAFERWVRALYAGIEKASGVYNGKEIFTPSGNRRSFAATHYPATVEGIAKAMYDAHGGNVKNISANHDAKSLRAVTSKSFKSIEEMHKNEGRLKARTQEEADALTASLDKRLSDFASDVLSTKPKSRDAYESLIAHDQVVSILQDAAAKKYTTATIKAEYARYGYNITDTSAGEAKRLLDEISIMPVNIFEAKPERAVYFDEVRYAIVPDTMSDDVRRRLEDVVPDVREYAEGDEAQRLELLNARDDLMFQLRDPDQISDRELLANVMESAATNETERDMVARYRKHIDTLNEKQAELDKTNRDIVNARKEGRKADAAALKSKADILAKQIDREDGQLLKYEAAAPLKAVVKRQREALRQKARARTNERVEKVRQQEAEKREKLRQTITEVREDRDRKIANLREANRQKIREVRDEKDESYGREKYRKRIEEDVKTLRTWVTSPTNKEHVPQFLRAPLGDMIAALDFSSVSSLSGRAETLRDQKFADALEAMNAALAKVRSQQEGLDQGAASFAGMIDLPYGYTEAFTELAQKIKATLRATQDAGGNPIYRMKSAELKELSRLIRTLTTSIRQMNRLLANAKYDSAVSAARATVDDLKKMAPKKDGFKVGQAVGRFLDWTNTVPFYAFKRFGKGGQAIFDGLQDGWDKLAFNTSDLIKYAETAYNEKEVRAWSREIQNVKLSDGSKVRMTTAQLMSLYCLSKRAQAVGHLLGGGIRIADIDSRGKSIVQSDNYTLTQMDLDNFAKMLNARQKAVADKLQKFMSTRGSEWGNEVSMKRFGYEMFTEDHYFPIETDANNRVAMDEQAQENSLFRLLNMSATKGLVKGANNALVVRNIFDVFAAHTADMAKYNALGLPILDALKWLNYVEKTQNEDGTLTTESVQKSLERAYGTDARRYIINLLRDLNGVREGGRNDGLVNKMISNAKIASVAGNVRVYLLQATSMPRAAYAIDPKYLTIGLAKMAANPRKGMRLATEKVGIGMWKSLGFYDTNISGNIREMIKHDQSVPEVIRKKAMAPAGLVDNLTLGVIYYAAEAEVAKNHSGVVRGGKVWDKLINDRVRDIVYRTQVVDSTMTRSDAMRGKGIITLATSFMSEPTLTMNMLADSIYDARMKHRGADVIGHPTANMARAMAVFTFTAVLTAAAEALFNAERDDDEYETFGEKYMSSFIGDLTEADTAWKKFTTVLFSDVGSNLNVLNNIPLASDAMSMLEGYENSPMYSAFIDSFKSSFDAYQRWQEGKGTVYSWIYSGLKGLSQFSGLPVSNITREGVSVWNTFFADKVSRPRIQTYANTKKDAAAAYYEAIGSGDNSRAAFVLERARINGISEDDVSDSLVPLFKEDYVSKAITEGEARRYLENHTSKDDDEIDDYLNKWAYERDTGLQYSNMKVDYTSGLLTKAKATELLMKYRGYDADKAYWTISGWEYSKTHDGEDGGKMSWFLEAVEKGSGWQARADELLSRGTAKGDIASQITATFKDAYREAYGTAEGDRLREHLLDVYEYIGYDRDYEWNRYMSKWMDD